MGDGFQIPTVLSGASDMTWELTSWIAANKSAKEFADGAFDPWGAHVNTDYLDMTLPTNTLSPMDPYPPIAHRYDPFFPLSSVAQYQVNNWYPATDWQPDVYGNYDTLQPEIPAIARCSRSSMRATQRLTSCPWHRCRTPRGNT